jgi:hypothetical protein
MEPTNKKTESRAAAAENAFMAKHEAKDAAAALQRGDVKFAAHEAGDAIKYEATAAKDAIAGGTTHVPPATMQRAEAKEAARAESGGGGGGTAAAAGTSSSTAAAPSSQQQTYSSS